MSDPNTQGAINGGLQVSEIPTHTVNVTERVRRLLINHLWGYAPFRSLICLPQCSAPPWLISSDAEPSSSSLIRACFSVSSGAPIPVDVSILSSARFGSFHSLDSNDRTLQQP